MKIRTQFVSNSSSTSFIIYGCSLPKEEIFKVFRQNNWIEIKNENPDEYQDYDRKIEEAIKKNHLNMVYYADYENYHGYLGLELYEKTIKQLSQEAKFIEKFIKDNFQEKCRFIGGEVES